MMTSGVPPAPVPTVISIGPFGACASALGGGLPSANGQRQHEQQENQEQVTPHAR